MIAVSLNVNTILCYDRADALFYIEEVETRYKIGQADADAARARSSSRMVPGKATG